MKVKDTPKLSFTLTNLTYAILPRNDRVDIFDFDLLINENQFVGIESNNLKFVGKGKVLQENGIFSDLFIEGPLDTIKYGLDIEKQDQNKPLNQLMTEIQMDLDPKKIKITSSYEKVLEPHSQDQIRGMIKNTLAKQISFTINNLLAGEIDHLTKHQHQALAPFISLYYAQIGAEMITFYDNFVEYGFSPVSLKFEEKAYDNIQKPIESKFLSERRDTVSDRSFSLIVDENFINGVVGQFIKTHYSFSLTELLKLSDYLSFVPDHFTTTTIAQAVNQYRTYDKMYGRWTPFDIISTFSDSFLQVSEKDEDNAFKYSNEDDEEEEEEEIDEDKIMGINIKKNGDMTLRFNMDAAMNLMKDGQFLKMIRVMKGVLTIKLKAQPSSDKRYIDIVPKSIQLGSLQSFMDNKEQYFEQTVFFAFINSKMQKLKYIFSPIRIPLRDIKNPKELQCLGFHLQTLDFRFNEKYVQIDGEMGKLKSPVDQQYCDKLERSLQTDEVKTYVRIVDSALAVFEEYNRDWKHHVNSFKVVRYVVKHIHEAPQKSKKLQFQ